MKDGLLPIGTVVRLVETDHLVVILGFFPDNGEEMFDYFAAVYPAGLANENHAVLLNESGIAEVVHRGYLDDVGMRALEAADAVISAQEEAYVAIGRVLEGAGKTDAAENTFGMK